MSKKGNYNSLSRGEYVKVLFILATNSLFVFSSVVKGEIYPETEAQNRCYTRIWFSLKSYTLVKLPILDIFTGACSFLEKAAFCWSVDETSNVLRYWLHCCDFDAYLLFWIPTCLSLCILLSLNCHTNCSCKLLSRIDQKSVNLALIRHIGFNPNACTQFILFCTFYILTIHTKLTFKFKILKICRFLK